MTPADFDRAAVDIDLYRRAFARCTASVPHRDADEDMPCSGCLLSAARQLAIPASHLPAAASTPSSVAPQPCAEGVDGAAGSACPAVKPPVAPPSAENNRPPAVNEGPAEGATAIARNEGTR